MCLEPETRQNGTLSVFHPAPWMEGECQGIRKLSLRGRNFLFRGVGERVQQGEGREASQLQDCSSEHEHSYILSLGMAMAIDTER